MFVLWWVEQQLADNFSRDNESASRYSEVRLIVDNALLQAEVPGREKTEVGMSEDVSGEYLTKVERLKELRNRSRPEYGPRVI
jgi:hypothetical protein